MGEYRRLLAATAGSFAIASAALGAPTGGSVVAGRAAIESAGTRTTIDQSTARAVIDWRSFDVGPAEAVVFRQPERGSTLNRVLSGNGASVIDGAISATGTVIIQNNAGVVFGPGAQVETGGLIATARTVDASAFMDGRLAFGGGSGSVVNHGRISVREAGLAALIGGEVRNDGLIEGKRATVILAAGPVSAIDLSGDGLVAFAEGLGGAIEASGTIEAQGGRILMTTGDAARLVDGAINLSGVARASSAIASGGSVTLLAGDVRLSGTATIDASGATDGGHINIGGASKGGPDLPAAEHVTVSTGARVLAAGGSGTGGQIVLWSEINTRMDGLIDVRGATGGFVETSSRGDLGIGDGATVMTGAGGHWLLDPRNISITAGGSVPVPAPCTPGCTINPPAPPAASTVNAPSLVAALNAGSNVTITTTQPASSDAGNITVSGALNWTTGNGSLTLRADNDILINAAITTAGGGFSAFATRNIVAGSAITTANGAVLLDAGGSVGINNNMTATAAGSIEVIARTSNIFFGGTGNRTIRTSSGPLTLRALVTDVVLQRPTGASNLQVYTDGGGLLTIAAGRDVRVEAGAASGGWTRIGRLSSTGAISISAGRSIIQRANATLANAFAEIVGQGPIALNANFSYVGSAGGLSGANVQAQGASLNISTPAGLVNNFIESFGDTTFTGTYSINVSPSFTLAANRSFTLSDASTLTASVPVSIKTSGTGNVVLGGSVSAPSFDATAGNDLTLESTITADGAGNALVLAAGSRIINQAGNSALSTPNGRWLTYSVSPLVDTGGAPGPAGFNLYGRTLTANPPSSLSGFTGNRRVFSFSPTLTFTADSGGKVYGDAAATLGFTVSGLLPGDLLSDALTASPSVDNPGAPLIANAGSYATSVLASASPQGYQLAFVNGSFVVTPAPLTVTADALTKIYGNPDPTLTFAASGFRNGQDASELTGALARATGENVADYAIDQGTLAGANYAISFTGAPLSITPASLTVSADALAKIYGDPDPALTYAASGFKFSDTVASVLTGGLSRAAGENVGGYAIGQGALAANGNYTLAFSGNTLAINPATLSVSADAQHKIYGDADPALTFAATGFKFADTPGSVLTGGLTRTAGENAGLYGIGQGSLAANTNYVLSYSGNALRIDPASLLVTADPLAKIYGDQDPALTYVTSGLRFDDTAGSVLSGALTRSAGENTGLYAIGQGSLSANGNYALSFGGSQLRIDPATLSVVALPGGKIYGDPDPALAFDATGFRFTDTAAAVLTGALARDAGEDAGGYAVRLGSLAAGANYVIDFSGALFSIDPAALTVTAPGFTREYGDPNPALTPEISGFRRGDGLTALTTVPVVSSSATVTSPVGTYLTSANGGVAANYRFVYIDGQATIVPAPLAVTARPASRLYGDADPVFAFDTAGLKLSDTPATVLSGALGRAAGEDVGSYAISQGSLLSNANYTLTFTGSQLTIDPAPLAVTVNDSKRLAFRPNPDFTVSYSGFRRGDAASVLDGSLAYSTQAVLDSPPGFYPVTANGLTGLNYVLTFFPGTLAVVPIETALIADAQLTSQRCERVRLGDEGLARNEARSVSGARGGAAAEGCAGGVSGPSRAIDLSWAGDRPE